MKYARSENNVVVQVIGNDPANLFAPEHAALFRACADDVQPGWLDDGQTFTAPPAPPVPVPQSVTMRQTRLALFGIGKLTAVDAILNSLQEPQRTAAKIEWEFSSTVERNRPLVLTLGPALSLDAAALDSLFITAAGL